MAFSYSETARQALATTYFGGAALTVPSSYDLALFTGDPNNGGVECTGTGYARIALTNNGTNWVVVTGTNYKTYRNGTDWIWTASAGAGWGIPNWVGLYNGGTLLMGMEISNATPVLTGEAMRILANGMQVQFLN